MRENQKIIALFKENNVSPFSAFWGFAQIPVFISFFLAVKKMAELPVPGFTSGGLAWITDLSLADPLYILPVAASASMLLSMEVGIEVDGRQIEQLLLP
jgi:YidC/Oxa1 family membrane protein insertase